MGWVHSDIWFAKRMGILTVPKDCPSFRYLLDLAALAQGPQLTYDMLLEFIEKTRPDLVGCEIRSMHFDPAWCQWEIAVSHRSLPEVADGAMIQKIPLFETEAVAAQ